MPTRLVGHMRMAYLFFVFLVLLPTQLGKHWWPQWSLVSGVRIDYLSPTLYLTDIILVFLICLALWKNRKSVRDSLKRTFSFTVLFSIFYFLFSIFHSPRPLLSFYSLARYTQIPLVAWVTHRVQIHVGTDRFWRLTRSGLATGVLWTVALATAHVLVGRTLGWFWILGERSFTLVTPGIATLSVLGRTVLRPYATFPHPNALAGFLGICFLLLGAQLSQHRRLTRVTHLSVGAKLANLRRELVAARFAGAIARRVVRPSRAIRLWRRTSGDSERANVRQRATTTRGTLFLRLSRVLAGIGVLLSASRLAIASLTIASVVTLAFSRAPAIMMFSPQSTEERLILTGAVLRMITDYPLFGVGPGQFLVKLPGYLPRGTWLLQPVHNIPLLLFSEFGLVGSALIGVFVLKFLKLSTIHYYPLSTIFLFLLLTSLGDHYWVTVQQNRLLLGVVLGLLTRSSSAQRRGVGFSPRPLKTS